MRYWDQQELAAKVCGLSDEEYSIILDDDPVDRLDELLMEKLGVSFEDFITVAEALLPFTPKVQTAISGDEFHAFVDKNVMLLREKV